MRRHSLSLLILSLSFAMGATMTVSAQSIPAVVASDSTLLTISAQAEARRVPDIATIPAGVLTQAVDGNSAMRENAVQMEKVMSAIKAAGIAERDIQTSGINLSPQYDYAQNETPKITGYQASNIVSLKVRDISKLGKVLDALAAQGANQISGPSFEIDKPEPVYDEARLAALKNAQARAETYAKSLGLKVRRIVSISEGSQRGFSPMPMMMMSSARSAKAEMDTAVSPGEITLSVNLEVAFELGR